MRMPTQDQLAFEGRCNRSNYLGDQPRITASYGTGEKWENEALMAGLGDTTLKLLKLREESIKLLMEFWRAYVISCLANSITPMTMPDRYDRGCVWCHGCGYVIVDRLPEKERVVVVECRCRPKKGGPKSDPPIQKNPMEEVSPVRREDPAAGQGA